MRVLLTGATGFIGSHAVEHYLRTTDWDLVVLDGLNYASSAARLTDIACWEEEKDRVQLVFHDLQAPLSDDLLYRLNGIDTVIHFAAETHVDRSLVDPRPFIMTNVVGTLNILEYARTVGVHRFIQIGTDEVFGPAPDGVMFKEDDRFKPSNPYAASKAGADVLASSYFVSFKVPVIVTRTMNNFGERQHPEKFIPKTVKHILAQEPVVLHGTPGHVGSRCWLHARNHADAVKFLIEHGTPGEAYHISSNDEYSVEQMATLIAQSLGAIYQATYVDFHATRPGHDRRYALDGSKLLAMGWTPPVRFVDSLDRTVQWIVDHSDWLMMKGVR